METDKLICNTSNLTYDKGYIALWLQDYPLPQTMVIQEDTLLKKDHFHVSLLCVKHILEVKPDIEEKILENFCNFINDNKLTFQGFTNEFRLAEDLERKSIVALCDVSNLHKFAEYLTDQIGIKIPPQPAHVTIYTLQPNVGIGLSSPDEMERKSIPIEVPENIQIILQ
jgi:hypothetical protein